jgi:hypothetical protein
LKFQSVLSLFFMGIVIAAGLWLARDGLGSIEARSARDSRGSGNFASTSSADRRLENVRARADAAFAEATRTPERFESRVGPQPWPDDLPSNWPKPTSSRVVANAKRAEGDRLVLIDLPLSPAEAVDAYRSQLQSQGYAVTEVPNAEAVHSLRAKSGQDEAVLRFFRRDRATRIEILFIARARG